MATAREHRGWLLAALLVAAAPALLAACGDTEARNPSPAVVAPAPIPVAVALAEERRLPGGIDVTGALMADAQTDVPAEVSGRVVEVLVERGHVVAAGAVLVRLDERDATSQLREAEALEAQTREKLALGADDAFDPTRTADVIQARVTLERMQVEFQRYERLVDMGAVSRSEYDLKRNEFLAQKAQHDAKVNEARWNFRGLQAQRARVAQAEKALADTTIRAPYGGLIAEKHVNVGQFVQRGARVATLVKVDTLRVELSVPETAVAAVKRGQRVSFTVQTYPGRTFAGTVAYVGPALRAESRSLVAEALVPNPDGALQPGLFATARIELPAPAPSLYVPEVAVRTEAGVSRLFVIKDGHAEQRIVQIGREVEGRVEILRGLDKGEAVAVDPIDRLGDGVAVAVTRRARGR